MKFIVIGKSAVLETRDIERIDPQKNTNVIVENVPDGATLSFIGEDVRSHQIISEKTQVNFNNFPQGDYKTCVDWDTVEDGKTVSHEAYGNPIKIAADAEGIYIIPAPLSSASEIEYAWQAIADILGVLIPLNDDVKNGVNVV